MQKKGTNAVPLPFYSNVTILSLLIYKKCYHFIIFKYLKLIRTFWLLVGTICQPAWDIIFLSLLLSICHSHFTLSKSFRILQSSDNNYKIFPSSEKERFRASHVNHTIVYFYKGLWIIDWIVIFLIVHVTNFCFTVVYKTYVAQDKS